MLASARLPQRSAVGARRLLFELGKARVSPLPSQSTIYRVFARQA
jgi:hypothetical protein